MVGLLRFQPLVRLCRHRSKRPAGLLSRPPMLLTADLLQRASGCGRGAALTFAQPMSEACALYEIDSRERMAAFIAVDAHESQAFQSTSENLNYSAAGLLKTWPARFTPALAASVAHHPALIAGVVYAGRMGNRDPADAYVYRGRGLLMTTGRSNYEAVCELLRERVHNVPDIGAMPDILAEPKWAAYSAAALWCEWGLNALADAGDFLSISRKVNLGDKNSRHMPIDWDIRHTRYAKARGALA